MMVAGIDGSIEPSSVGLSLIPAPIDLWDRYPENTDLSRVMGVTSPPDWRLAPINTESVACDTETDKMIAAFGEPKLGRGTGTPSHPGIPPGQARCDGSGNQSHPGTPPGQARCDGSGNQSHPSTPPARFGATKPGTHRACTPDRVRWIRGFIRE